MYIRTITALILLAAAPIRAQESGPAADGKALFTTNCQRCHGPDASTGKGGDIRGSHLRSVRKATGGFETMPEFDLTDDELDALVAYLATL